MHSDWTTNWVPLKPVAAVAVETAVCPATLFRWKHQALIDGGIIEGIPSVEAGELAAAHKRIAALEANWL